MTPIQITPLDVTRPAKEILVAKLNAMNSTNLDPLDFVVMAPAPWAGVNYDTKVELRPTVTSAWYNAITLYYRRLELAELFTTHLRVVSDAATTVHAVLPAINAAYGIHLTVDDVEDEAIVYQVPADLTTTAVITLVAKTGSLLFKGIAELTLNQLVDQGVGTYDDGQTYFAVVTVAGLDLVKAFNSQGVEHSTFSYLEGATVVASSITKMVRLTNSLLVLGTFSYTPINTLGAPETITVKAVKMDNRGNITGTAVGDRFGAVYPLTYFPDVAHDKLYALDPTNAIGGHLHQVHRYLLDGLYDATLNLVGLLTPVQTMAVATDGSLYLACSTGDGFELHKRLPDGSVDPLYTTAVVAATTGTVTCEAIAITATGVYLRLGGTVAKKVTNAITVNAAPLWAVASDIKSSAWVPVIKLTLVGAADSAFHPLHEDRGASALGVNSETLLPVELKQLVASSTYVGYIGSRVSALFGFETVNMIALDATTARVQDTSAEFPVQPAIWSAVHGVAANQTGEIAVWGALKDIGHNDGGIALYSKRGVPGGVFVTLHNAVVKDVISAITV